MNETCLLGVPGSGKTYRLTRLAIAAINTLGASDRIGAVTFTRTAATELKGRIAAELGIAVPSDASAARNVLDRVLPWVGTIHSLCYRLLGRPPMITGQDLKDFAHSVDPRSKLNVFVPADPTEISGYEYGDVSSQDEIELALQLHAMARHRMIPIAEAFRYLPARSAISASPDRLEWIARRYEQFKEEVGKLDFESLLEQGRDIPLPVKVLLADEVQDNSALLWSVLDGWAGFGIEQLIEVGDYYQAIYSYSGASPELFKNRKGRWHLIGNSRRLSASSAAYAQGLLRYAGYDEDTSLSTWTGTGGTPTEGGSQFYLARTNRLLNPIRDMLEDRGTPYRLLRGVGPLQMKAAQAFRSWHNEIRDGSGAERVTVGTAALIADQIPPGQLPHGFKAQMTRLAAADPDSTVSDAEMRYLRDSVDRIPNYTYYQRVVAQRGIAGLIMPPRIAVSTIHGCKGREADHVSVVRSWGFLPGRAMMESLEGRLAEACVGYVASSRHRQSLTILDGIGEGIDYPFAPIPPEMRYQDPQIGTP